MAEEKLRAALGGLLERMRVAGLKSFADELYAALAATPEQASLRPEAVKVMEEMLAPLKPWLMHSEDCESVIPGSPPCTCGLAAALQRLLDGKEGA